MNVQELINELEKITDKTAPVMINQAVTFDDGDGFMCNATECTNLDDIKVIEDNNFSIIQVILR